MEDFVKELQDWYDTNCNGEWEHQFGIEIGTLDNPGWRVEIDLRGTHLANCQFEPIESSRSSTDWLICHVVKQQFIGHGGVQNLKDILGTFFTWSKSNVAR